MTSRHHGSVRLSTRRLERPPISPEMSPPFKEANARKYRRDRGPCCDSDMCCLGSSPDGGAPGWSRDVWARIPALRRSTLHTRCRRVRTGENQCGGSTVERSLQGAASSDRRRSTSTVATRTARLARCSRSKLVSWAKRGLISASPALTRSTRRVIRREDPRSDRSRRCAGASRAPGRGDGRLMGARPPSIALRRQHSGDRR